MNKKLIPTIGLEIHVELKTASKMFCSCKNNPEEKKVNFNICPICMGHPGTLPVANEEAIRKLVKAGIALNCEIQKKSNFDRKNYFYPDLPKGYQISQNDNPLCKKGYLKIDEREIKITRIHLEEDTGSLIHSKGKSLVNFNRAGVPLMELVTEPDITSGKEAKKFGEQLQLILRYLDVSEANMEKGQMRVEVNISLAGENDELGTKVEIKNLNSFRSVKEAVDYEIKRQTEILKNKGKVIQQTRGWDADKKETKAQRKKEESHDYRYFPDPDLPPLILDDEFIREIQREIPELPSQKRERFKEEYDIPEEQIEIYISKKDLSEYFENVASELREWVGTEKKINLEEEEFKKVVKLASNYLSSDVLGLINLNQEASFSDKVKATPENFGEFIKMIYLKEISSKTAKDILKELIETGKDPSHIVEEKGLSQIRDESEIEKIIQKVIKENPDAVENFKKGKKEALKFLVGQVMKESRGKADPMKVNQLLEKELSS